MQHGRAAGRRDQRDPQIADEGMLDIDLHLDRGDGARLGDGDRARNAGRRVVGNVDQHRAASPAGGDDGLRRAAADLEL